MRERDRETPELAKKREGDISQMDRKYPERQEKKDRGTETKPVRFLEKKKYRYRDRYAEIQGYSDRKTDKHIETDTGR